MEDLRLAPYASWGEMEQYAKEGSRDFFLQCVLGQTSQVFFALAENKGPIVRIINSNTNYVGEFGVEDHHERELVAFLGNVHSGGI